MSTHNATLKQFERFLLPALAIITLFVFSPVLWHDFVNFDDPDFVYSNPYIQSGVTLESIRWAFTTGYQANWIPLTWITHMLDVQFFGLNPAMHHLGNLLMHVASSCLLFTFLKRATGGVWQSAAVASLFALHPLHVESVAWVAERKDVLSALFFMLTLHAWLRYSESPGMGRYLIAVVCFILGLLSKSMLVTLPVVLLLLDCWPFQQWRDDKGSPYTRRSLKTLVAEKIPFFALSVCASLITYTVHHARGEAIQGYTLLSKVGKSCIAYTTYLVNMVWPVDLAVLYPFPKYPPTMGRVLVSVFFLIIVSGFVIWLSKSHPYLLTGWLWYLLTLLPVIGLIQIGQHTVADRYTYIPLTGVFIMIVWGGAQLARKYRLPIAVTGAASLIILVVMIVLTVKQLSYWQNSFTLFSRAIAVTSENWVAHNNLGIVLEEEGKTDEAIAQYKLSIKAKPSYGLAYMNLGMAYRVKKEFTLAEDAFRWSLKFEPYNPIAHFNLGLLYLDIGRYDLAEEEYKELETLGSPFADEMRRWLEKFRAGSVR